jgi:hypothetical protein
MKPVYLLAFIMLVFSACDNEKSPDCFKKTGEIETKIIDLDSFEYIDINDLFNVVLIQDSTNKLEIKGGKNVIQKVEFTQNDTLLSIENTNTCNWTRSYQEVIELDIHFTELKRVGIYGQVYLTNRDTIYSSDLSIVVYSKASKANLTVNTNQFRFSLWEATGEYYLHGKTNYSYYGTGRYGYIYAKDLKSKYVRASNESTGDIYVNADNSIQAWLSSYGNIYYTGNATDITIEEESSTGKLIKLENK